MARFFRVQLRTLQVDAARAFYAALFDAATLDIVPLQEQAIARGARPHWLGYLPTDDVNQTLTALLARGASVLGLTWRNAEGLEAATLRDPGGAVLAVGKPPRADDATRARDQPVAVCEDSQGAAFALRQR